MKVKIGMMAKGLRFAGVFAQMFAGGVPEKETLVKKNKRKKPAKLPEGAYNQYIQRPDGSQLRLLVWRPKGKPVGKVPGILWLHGGGYAGGEPEFLNITLPKYMREVRECVFVSPDYTLSIEKPYPAALDDCCLALLWLRQNAGELGVRSDQLFVGGESAGGGLAAATCLRARDEGQVRVACQMLVYPMLDDRMQTPSSQGNNAPCWNTAQNAAAWALYLEGMDRTKPPKYASPSRETDYTGLPPAIAFVGDIEPFCDETVQYVDDLREAGVDTAFMLCKGCYHAFDIGLPKSAPAKEAREFFLREFTKACDTRFLPQE